MRNQHGHVVKALCVYPHDSSPNPTLDGHYLDLVVLNSAPPCFPKNELVAFLYVGFLALSRCLGLLLRYKPGAFNIIAFNRSFVLLEVIFPVPFFWLSSSLKTDALNHFVHIQQISWKGGVGSCHASKKIRRTKKTL